MKLLTAIKRQPADNCIILTFNADLLFFEHMVFEPLYGAGCRNTLVLCDPAQYSMALDDDFAHLPALAGVALFSVLGAPLGVAAVHRSSPVLAKRIFAAFLLVVAVKMLLA